MKKLINSKLILNDSKKRVTNVAQQSFKKKKKNQLMVVPE